jgi:hypothetical protein
MALTLDIRTNQAIDLEECLQRLKTLDQANLGPGRGLEEAANYLRMLSNNKEFLVDLVNAEFAALKDPDQFQSNNGFSQQIIDLGGTRDIWLRANLWPASSNEFPADWEKSLFAYDMPHDHTSDFLTVGYWGPGYETEIYEYDPDAVIGYDGESVDLTFLEKTRLTEGKVMYYRGNRDVHRQIIPREFSISINLLLVNQERGFGRNQYWFDTERSIIESTVSRSSLTSFLFLCRLARVLGCTHAISSLEGIAQRHANPHIRVAAYQAIVAIEPAQLDALARRARTDPHAYVRHMANYLTGSPPAAANSGPGRP